MPGKARKNKDEQREEIYAPDELVDASHARDWRTIVKMMTADPKDASLQHASIAALRRIGFETVAGFGGLKGAYAAVFSAMKAHEQVDDVQLMGCPFLASLMVECPEMISTVVRDGGVEHFFSVMKTHSSKQEVLIGALGVLYEVSIVHEGGMAIYKQDGVAIFLDVMRRFPEEDRVQTSACIALSCLINTCREGIPQALRGECIGIVMRAVTRHASCESLQACGVGLFAFMAAVAHNNQGLLAEHVRPPPPLEMLPLLHMHPTHYLAFMGESDFVVDKWCVLHAVLHAMKLHKNCPSVQENCCKAVGNFYCYMNADTIAFNGGIDMTLEAMATHKTHVEVVRTASGALNNFSQSHPEDVFEKGILVIMARAMPMHVSNQEVVDRGISCVSYLFLGLTELGKDTSKLVDEIHSSGCFRAIVSGMSAQLRTPSTQSGGCELMAMLCEKGTDSARVAAEGGIQAVYKAMKAHKDDGKIQKLGGKVLDCIARKCSEHSGKIEEIRTKLKRHKGNEQSTMSCAACGKSASQLGLVKLSKCSGCTLDVKYCGSQCQNAHWKTHKADCKANKAK